jgi:hypothetical protein
MCRAIPLKESGIDGPRWSRRLVLHDVAGMARYVTRHDLLQPDV